MKLGIVFLALASCGGEVGALDSGALVPDVAPAVDAPMDQALDVPTEAAPDSGTCPVLGALCDPKGPMWCTDDRAARWVCFTGMWERQPCLSPDDFCEPSDGGFSCVGAVCK